MGVVYRARDTKLGRDVAIKLLPGALASDSERLGRFEREAKALAALNHPHIAQIYGLEEAGGAPALVMELVDGPTLAERIAHGALPVEDALPIAGQIAAALEAAHERGIVHRDLKPANIKLTADGTVKVLDFGLAKAFGSGADPFDPGVGQKLENSPTLTSPLMTRAGIILGTTAYMAPEQAKGKPTDKRADIWAFGAVLYEMLTGRALFAGETASETLASVIKDEPPLDRLPAGVPPPVRRLIARCLERDPRLRLRDIGEARILLARARYEEEAAGSAPPAASRRLTILLAAGGIALAAIVGAGVWYLKPETTLPVRRFELPAALAAASQMAFAPDGSGVAYLADGRLWVRALHELEPRDLGPVPVTSFMLFWSPDSRMIGFAADGTLRSIPAAGGAPFTICRLPAAGQVTGAAWRTDGTIVFAAWRDSLYSVPASGGKPEVLLAIDPATEIDFHSVSALPDNRVLVSTHLRANDPSYRVELIERGGNRRNVLISDPAVDVVQYAQQHVLFHRSGANEGIWAVPFTEGPIDPGLSRLVASGARIVGAAADGTLIVRWHPSRPKVSLVWLDRKGATAPVAGPTFERGSPPALSANGRRAAFFVSSEQGPYLIVRDLHSGLDTRLTFQGSDRGSLLHSAVPPMWFPAGDRVIYTIGGTEATKLVAQTVDGTSGAREITSADFGRISPDGRLLLYAIDDRGTHRLHHAPLGADGTVGPGQRVFQGNEEPNVNGFDLSPDGTMLAYAVTQPDRQSNIFLTKFPSGSGRWQVTSSGGKDPRFARNGREIFYLTGGRDARGRPIGKLMAVPLTTQPTVTLGAPVTLAEEGAGPAAGLIFSGYDVAADGRFLMVRSDASTKDAAARLVLVQNWLRAIRE